MQVDLPGVLFIMVGLVVLFLELVLMLTALPLINRRLRQSGSPIPAPVQSDIIAPLATSKPRETNGLDP